MLRNIAVWVLLAALLPGGAARAETADVPALLAAMKEAVAKLADYRVVQLKRERFGDNLAPAETMEMKLSRGRVYLKFLSGSRAGAEALYAPGWNSGKVRIHKGSFPDVTLNLDRHSSLLLEGQHHPIDHAGFTYLVATVVENVRRGQESGEGKTRLVGETRVSGRAADVLELSTPGRATSYVVQKGDSLWALAPRLGVDPFVLLHHNNLRRADSLKSGMTVQVPAYYGSRVVLAVDRQSHLPSRLEVYDARGRLYELYEWSQLSTAPLASQDFDPANSAYKF